MIEAILFDMDGVLIDSEPIILQAAMQLFADKGVIVKKEDFTPFIGTGDKRYLLGVGEKYGLGLDFEVEKLVLFAHYARIAKESGPLGGVIRFITNAKKAGLKIALVTSAVRMKMLLNLEAIGVDESIFDKVVTGDMVKRNKPYGDIYQIASLLLGIDADKCLVVEDALNGTVAGKAAGCTVLGLTTTFGREELFDSGADAVMSTLDEFEDYSDLGTFNELLRKYIGSYTGTPFGANIIADSVKEMDESVLGDAIDAALKVRLHAYAPYSNYQVGSAIVSYRTKKVYPGANVENSSYGATICAERSALLRAIADEGVIGIECLVVVSSDSPPAPPCAQCLQVLAEFSRGDTTVHLLDVDAAEGRDGVHLVRRFDELLPHPFIFPSKRL
ncbi:MAG TPA: cytidine deaminase [Sphaerochaeta sp.]|nr:cytidine deaminase [Sphaerochaeta sp.]HQB54281.1 cytidine deaminase [Sphaerochaeta sp.]